MKKSLITILLAFALVMSLAFAIDPSGAVVTDGSEYGPIAGPSAETTDVTAGYIKEANLDTNQSTLRWAGITGNVSGEIQLGDGASANVMYSWSASGNLVYASTQATPVWASLATTTGGAIDGSYLYLDAADSDSATNTFAGVSEDIGSNIFSVSSVYANTTGGTPWQTYALTDGADYVYAGKVQDDTNFRGDTADFQMIVPEDGTAGDALATTYSLWVELI